MKKVRSSLLAGLSLVAALSISGLLAAPIGCKKAPTTTEVEPSAPSILPDKELMQRTWDAWSTLDPEQAAPFYAKEPDLVFFDFAPLQFRGWDAYSTGVKEMLAQFTSFKGKVKEDAKIDVLGDKAIGASIVQMEITFQDGMTESFNARWTVVWAWREGQWLIVHEHLSVPIDGGHEEGEAPQNP
ncbi:YybH family protein [Polyangium spumosum]|nr:nuclear transport factor 2 family protein [Polyangium spumosum]